jgi:cobyrinic acid a,c-diamide synthase
MLGHETVKEVFFNASRDADISIIEGVMGLYDGKEPLSNKGSTAEISTLLDSPVLLVIDGAGMARSAAAIVKGFQNLDSSVNIAGVIVNRVGSEGHYLLIKAAIEDTCCIPVVGYLLADDEIRIPERHLGLVPAIERGEPEGLLSHLGDMISSKVDIDKVLQIAHLAPEIELQTGVPVTLSSSGERVVIAVTRDLAFNFYYQENFELLQKFGAELRFFSPLNGELMPEDANGLYIGGGFPEEFASELSTQRRVMENLRDRIVQGIPTYAECGGYMFLAKSLTTLSGQTYEMVGIIPAHVTMRSRLSGFGYREVEPSTPNWLMESGDTARGHEFHYSTIEYEGEHTYAYRLVGRDQSEGYLRNNVVAGYTHLHFGSNPKLAHRFVEACRMYKKTRSGV